MIEPYTGQFAMIEPSFVPEALAAGNLVMVGTEDEVRQVASRVRLGNAEADRRSGRRKQQRASRRANRRR